MGDETLDAIEAAVARHGIDCDFQRTGELTVAVADWQAEGLAEEYELARSLGRPVELLDREQVQREVASPTYLAGLHDPRSTAILDPAKLAWGLAAAMNGWACGSSSKRPPSAWSGAAPAWRCAPRTGRFARPRCCWPPARSRRCCAGWPRTWCRCGTTR